MISRRELTDLLRAFHKSLMLAFMESEPIAVCFITPSMPLRPGEPGMPTV